MSVRRVAAGAAAVLVLGLVCGGDCTNDFLEALFPGAGSEVPGPGTEQPDDGQGAKGTFPRVRITVEYAPADGEGERKRGNFIIELNDELAPLSSANFLAYLDAGFYDETVIHRVDAGLGVVQGGGFEVDAADAGDDDFTSEALVEKAALFDPVEHEGSNGLLNLRGTVGVARTSDPDSGTSQWYVNTVDNPELDPKHRDPGFTIFGRVVGGMSVVDEMQAVAVEQRDNFANVPVETIRLIRAARVGSAQDMADGGTSDGDEPEEPAKTRVAVSVEYTGQDGLRSEGQFTIELEEELAPISTANFLAYVDADFYDQTVIHRVDSGLGVIQGGGYRVDPSVPEGSPPVSQPLVAKEALFDPIENESDNGLRNVRGSVGVARTSDPDSGTSQWYVNTVDNPDLDATPTAPGYAIFGHVVEGMDVVDAIQLVAVESRAGLNDVPVVTVLVTSVARVE